MPGFRGKQRDDGETLAKFWLAAIDARPDWVLLVSFNEWHEDTQIEPTIITPPTTTDDTPTGTGYTFGYQYEGYGNLYLDILREKTLPGSHSRLTARSRARVAGGKIRGTQACSVDVVKLP